MQTALIVIGVWFIVSVVVSLALGWFLRELEPDHFDKKAQKRLQRIRNAGF